MQTVRMLAAIGLFVWFGLTFEPNEPDTQTHIASAPQAEISPAEISPAEQAQKSPDEQADFDVAAVAPLTRQVDEREVVSEEEVELRRAVDENSPCDGIPSPSKQATDKEVRHTTVKFSPADGLAIDPWVRSEILELRRQRGSLLDGTLLDETHAPVQALKERNAVSNASSAGRRNDEAEFARSLDVAANAGVHESAIERPTRLAEAPGRSDLAQPTSYDVPPTSHRSTDPFAERLRATARALDARANQVERAGDLSAAAEFRDLADRLRAAIGPIDPASPFASSEDSNSPIELEPAAGVRSARGQ